MSSFTVLLRRLLKQRGMSQGELGRRVGLSSAAINKIIKGRFVPRWHRGPTWAKALGLRGLEARDFIEAMAMASASPPVRRFVRRLQRNP